MPVVTTPVLQKQQSKLPTSMRYERVQDILQNDLALRKMLSPRSQAVDTRFGEKIMFSREVVEVTEAIHAEGKDAHKVPKNEVLRVAMRIMKVMPGNGDVRTVLAPPEASAVETPAVASPETRKAKVKAAAKPKLTASPAQPKPEPPKETVALKGEKPKKNTAAKAAAPATAKPKAEPVKPVKATKQGKPTSTEPSGVSPVNSDDHEPEADNQVPESELPPERQPLHLPAAFDPTRYPHYSVQSSIYSLLLSALNLSEHFEKFPNVEDRQRKLEALIKDYLETCDPIKIGS